MEDDKRVNYKLDAINKLINNLKLSISGNKEHDELGENNVIVNLDEISQKITKLHEMVKAEFDEFENQTLLTEKFNLVHSDLATISDKLTNITITSNELQSNFSNLIVAVKSMRTSNDSKNDDIIAAIKGLGTQVNRNTSNINSLDGQVDALEQA